MEWLWVVVVIEADSWTMAERWKEGKLGLDAWNKGQKGI